MLPFDAILVRGIPMSRLEVAMHEQRLGAMFFDESIFGQDSKRQACANVIAMLDEALRIYMVNKGLNQLPDEPIVIDIGDSGWLYVPVALFPPGSIISVVPTKDSPAGKMAWFRMKRMYKGVAR